MAIIAWLPSDSTLAGWVTSVPALGAWFSIVVPLAIRLAAPLILLRYFFDLDLFELVIVVLAQWLVSLLITPILALILRLL